MELYKTFPNKTNYKTILYEALLLREKGYKTKLVDGGNGKVLLYVSEQEHGYNPFG